MSDQTDALKRLHEETRTPPADRIGKLPRGGTQLDYLGHADVTDYLCEHDPAWYWEPPTKDELERLGCPAGCVILDRQGNPFGMWIALVVHGHRRLGYGTHDKPGEIDAVKKLISDALRNAAMRFGVGLSLWSKGEWEESDGGTPPPAGATADKPKHPSPLSGGARVAEAARLAGFDEATRREALFALTGKNSTKGMEPDEIRKALDGFARLGTGELVFLYDPDGLPYVTEPAR